MNLNTDFSQSTSIHPNGRDVKQYKVGEGKIRRKAMKNLSARQLATPSKAGYRRPGSMAR